jgi:hypothetical protein
MTEYDEVCFRRDMEAILTEYERIQTQEQINAFFNAILRTLDYRFTGGLVFGITDNVKTILDVANGNKSMEEAVADAFVGKLTNDAIKSIGDKDKETVAAFFVSLGQIKTNVRNPALEDRENQCIMKFNTQETKMFDLRDYLRKRMLYELTVEASVPVSRSYKVEQLRDLQYGDFEYNGLQPYHIRIVNSFRNMHISAGYGQSSLLYRPDETESPLFSNGRAVSFHYIDVGMGLDVRSEAFIKPLLEYGVRSFFVNQYDYEMSDAIMGRLQNIRETSTFQHYNTNLYINVGLHLNLKIGYLFGYYSFSGTKDHVWSSQVQAGLAVPLFRKNKYF